MSEYVLSLSYGKDSLACLGAIEELGWPLDRIVHAEVWATPDIPADLPPMVEFKAKADAIIKERWGLEVEHLDARTKDGRRRNYRDDVFYRVRVRGKNKGSICGFPMLRMPDCQKTLKVDPMHKGRCGTVQYIGIAADEPGRFGQLDGRKKSPLVEAGWTEGYCRDWCEENGLLSPIYTTGTRGGCWFCHNQSTDSLRALRRDYPELWALLLEWDKDSPTTFRAGCHGRQGHTVHDYERRFQMEDEHLLGVDIPFWSWDVLDAELNYRLF